ncbi:MAG: Cytochrome oxidase assembly [Verrucomicrobiales bacterium]|nr:Cytochrome oxidase assembly [Verrucomicrobiales bacterium]
MNGTTNKALRNFAIFTALATLYLICIGGLVTSHGVGMSVPDWPTTYGYNMFRYPISGWIAGVYYEHTHRLVASVLGLLTTILALWLWCRETTGKARWGGVTAIVIILGIAGGMMGIRTTPVFVAIAVAGGCGILLGLYQYAQTRASGARWLGIAALSAVILQGVLGGLRVKLSMDSIGVFHAMLAQLFFLLVAAIALLQTNRWNDLPRHAVSDSKNFRALFVGTTALIVLQLGIAATMRHQHAGLAIPDFPLAYGKLWPATDAGSIELYNAHRNELLGENAITAVQINLQMIHRIVALMILLAVAFCAGTTRKHLGWKHPLTKVASLWLGFIVLQVFLGAATIWTLKAADVATAHVAIGALSLVTGGLLSIVSYRILAPRNQNSLARDAGSTFSSNPVASSR